MRILKRCILCTLCIVLCIVACVSCTQEDKELSVKEITDIIKSYNDADIVWTSLEGEDISSYFGFTDEKIIKVSAFINDDDQHFDIAAAIQFETKKDMLAVMESLNKSLLAAENSFKNSSSNETEKIRNKLILKDGSTLVVVVSSNHEKIEKELKDKGFQPIEK